MQHGDAVLSVITYGELLYGAEPSQQRTHALESLVRLVSLLSVVPLPQGREHRRHIRGRAEAVLLLVPRRAAAKIERRLIALRIRLALFAPQRLLPTLAFVRGGSLQLTHDPPPQLHQSTAVPESCPRSRFSGFDFHTRAKLSNRMERAARTPERTARMPYRFWGMAPGSNKSDRSLALAASPRNGAT